MRIALILSLLLAIIAVIFALQNPAFIDVNLGPWVINGSTALILLVTFCMGVLVGILAATPTLMKRRKRLRQLERTRTEPETDWTAPESDIHTESSRGYQTE